MTNYDQMRFELALQDAIQNQIHSIVTLAGETVDKYINLQNKEKSQLRNVLNVASNTKSVEVITNFIRYQIGRDKKEGVWRQNNFGHKVIEAIEHDLEQTAEQVIKKLPKEFSTEQSENERRRVHHQITELYLGYLNRCFYYVVETNDKKQLHKSLEATKEKLHKSLEATNANQ